jgi:PAS domain S-box-containing protein
VKLDRKRLRQKASPVDIPIPNSVDRAVIATDLSGKIVFWNSVAERVYGWKWDEAIGQPITDLIVPKPEQDSAEKIMAQLRRGRTWTGKFRLRRRDGSEFVTTVTDQPMRDGKGNLIGIIGISETVESAEGTTPNEIKETGKRVPAIASRLLKGSQNPRKTRTPRRLSSK